MKKSDSERLEKQLTIAKVAVAATIAIAITGVVIANTGVPEIGPISIPEISLPSMPSIDIPEIISKVFTPKAPTAAPPITQPPPEVIPEIVEAIKPTINKEIPIFTWRDIKYVAASFFMFGGAASLASVAGIWNMINKRAARIGIGKRKLKF